MANRDELIQEAIDAIVNYDAAAAADVATRALAAGMAPNEIVNEGFVAGISQVGDAFEGGEVFLPELMLAAQAMDAATAVCNAALEGGAGREEGHRHRGHRAGRRARHRQGHRDRLPEGPRLRGHRLRPRRAGRDLHRQAPRSRTPTSSA